MYELIRISLQNWYLVDQEDIELRGASAFIGPTGAGKSSLQDAIQTVLTGNQARRLRLNASASGKSARTVRDYCLGNPGSGLPLQRSAAESVVVLVFHDKELGHFVSIGVALAACKDQPKEETLSRFIAPDYAYKSATFITKDEEGERFQPWSVIRENLKKSCPEFREYNANAGKFIQDMLVSMRPKGNPPDPKQFLKSFSNAIKFEPIYDPTEFVRTYLLEEDTLNVGRVRAEIQFWKEVNAKLAELEEKLKRIKIIHHRHFRHWAKAHVESLGALWTASNAEVDRTFLNYRNSMRKYKEAGQKLTGLESLRQNHRETVESAKKQLRSKLDIRAASDSSARLERIVLEIEKAEDRKKAWLEKLDILRKLKAPLNTLTAFDHVVPNNFDDAINAAESYLRIWDSETEDVPAWLGHNAAALGALTERIAGFSGLENVFQDKKDELSLKKQEVLEKLKDVKWQIDKIEKGESPLHPRTERLMTELIAEGYDVTPLCEVVRVREDRWQFAIEVLLGKAREALIVPPEQASDAISYMHTHRREFYGCHLVNTRKTENIKTSVSSDSLASMIETDNPHALAFMITRIGNVKMVESRQELEAANRAIMADGLYTSGMTIQTHRDLDRFILGREVQKRSLEVLRQKAQNFFNEKDAIEKDMRDFENAAQVTRTIIKTVKDETLKASMISRGLDDCRGELNSFNTRKERVEEDIDPELLQEIHDLESDIEAYQEELEEVEKEIRRVVEDRGMLKTSVENDRDSCRQATKERRQYDGAFAQEAVEQIFALGDVRDLTPLDAYWQQYQTIKSDKVHKDEKALLAKLRNEQRQIGEAKKQDAEKAQQRARDSLSGYIHDYRMTHPMPGDTPIIEGYRWIVAEHNRLENNELLPYREKAESARETVVISIKEDLLNKLHSKFEKVDHQLRTINRMLGVHRFTNQTYSFKKAVNERFRDFYDLARDVANDPQNAQTLLDFLDPEQTKQAQAKKLLNELIETEDDATPLADYREYFTFDVEMEDSAGHKTSLSFRAKTGSGGEGQAGFYVAIAASLASAYFPGARGHKPQGMGLAVFDEAFNKLDIKNTQALLKFMKALGLQVLLAAPETNRATFSEVLDTIITVNKSIDGEYVYVESEYPGERARQALHAANPEHLGVEGFREKIEKEQADLISEVV